MTTRFIDHLLEGIHSARPAANAVPQGTLYACSTHGLIYQSDGTSTWSTWASLGAVADILDLPTAETDTSLVLAPDGAGGVEFRAETGGGGTDPTIPSGGTLYDGTSTTGFTSFGSPDTFDADTTVPDCFYVNKNTMGTNNLVGAYHSVGSFPKTYTMRLEDARLFRQYQAAGIAIGEAGGAGKFVHWGLIRDPTVIGPFLQRYAWTTPSASSSNTDYGNNGNGSIGVGKLPVWLRYIVASSTDVTFQVSLNGFIYETMAASVNPGFTIGVFGFSMYTFTAVQMSMAIDWIHES